jgi:hypothetical protein
MVAVEIMFNTNFCAVPAFILELTVTETQTYYSVNGNFLRCLESGLQGNTSCDNIVFVALF